MFGGHATGPGGLPVVDVDGANGSERYGPYVTVQGASRTSAARRPGVAPRIVQRLGWEVRVRSVAL